MPKNVNRYLTYLNEGGLYELNQKDVVNFAKTQGVTIAKSIGGKVGTVALSYLAYRIFNKFINRCHSACYLRKGSGTTMKEDKFCYLNCRIDGFKHLVQILQQNIGECQKAKDPLKCKEDVEKRIESIKNKLEAAERQRDELRIVLMRQGRNIERAEKLKDPVDVADKA